LSKEKEEEEEIEEEIEELRASGPIYLPLVRTARLAANTEAVD
jgi:hypothetical protein